MRLNECYSIPDRFVKEIKEYDPALRIRWGHAEGRVRVERRVRRAPAPSQATAFDDAVALREGYMLILKFLPYEHNWPLILFTLAQTDLQRLSGALAFAERLVNQEQYEKARRQWNRRDDFRVMGRELYRIMNTIRTVPEGAGHRVGAIE